MTGTGRRNGMKRQSFHCGSCHALLAIVREEWVVLRTLAVTNAARKSERINGDVLIECECGYCNTFRWPVLQR